ncbi:MAG: EAL domain-containing protein, partial [Candidatus Thiodiazotropha sp. (ex Gloverina cf. vestifex)]|nr:EAL domain-containing protein [Candidatus Thiodiazotropha sp. (ex Gloverina cf. vestifex)]
MGGLPSGLVEKVSHILEQAGYPAGQLSLEVTESALMERENDAVATLSQLRDRGIHFSIDDFGTGYSSLAHLQRMPLDELKIDKSFVQACRYLVKDFGTSESPKSTRQRDSRYAPT